MSENLAPSQCIELAADIVSAYVRNNSVPSSELPTLISDIHATLLKITDSSPEQMNDSLKPMISAKKSITDDYLICLEDGKKFKSLKRHLRTKYNMTPEQYREKWNLPHDYPMVAPSYARSRSSLAKAMKLGQKTSEKDN